jgi:flavodoxin/formate hydrogenlyase subunit 6/NADH:ubiquinone oxidoreductase subunit I
MKSIIIYFSQTGNTEKIALAIQKGLIQITGQCDLVKIKEANPRRLQEYDLIGLGSPAIGYSEIGSVPPNLKSFINDLRFVGGKQAFAFCTHGTHGELFIPRITRLLQRRGLTVIGAHDCYGSVYVSYMPKPYPTDGHPDSIDLKEAENFGKEMAKRSRKILSGESNLIPAVPKLPSAMPKPPQRPGEPSLDDGSYTEMLKYHKEICLYPRCRLCMENCPMDGIDLTVNPPIIAKPCIECEFCTKICPTGALDDSTYNEFAGPITARDIKDFLLTDVNKAEAEGRFRPLIPKEKIGNGLPLYKTQTKHPKWIIGKGSNDKKA